jgi:hypothetical protein
MRVNAIAMKSAEGKLSALEAARTKTLEKRSREDEAAFNERRRAVHQMLDAGGTWYSIADREHVTPRQALNIYGSRKRFHDSEICAARRAAGKAAIAERMVAA